MGSSFSSQSHTAGRDEADDQQLLHNHLDAMAPYNAPPRPPPHPFPDMNVIFRGIPKMVQATDDVHRMADYMGDMRNMLLGMSAISLVGMLLFLVLKYFQGRRHRRRRRHHNQPYGGDSDQSSVSHMHVRTNGVAGGAYGGTNDRGGNYRRYSQPHQHIGNAWAHGKPEISDPMSTSTATTTAGVGGAMDASGTANNGGGGGGQQTPRHTPPISKPFGIYSAAPTPPIQFHQPIAHQPQQTAHHQHLHDYQSYAPASQHSSMPNGTGAKRLEPVKLTVEELPYADSP